jgi:acetoin utilization deacetylase AcuC-like enzyme
LLRDLENHGIFSAVTRLDVSPATVADLRRVHAPALIEKVRAVSARGGGFLDHGDTYATADSYDAARTAVGACLAATDAIMSGTARNGSPSCAPPATMPSTIGSADSVSFNNVAAAARYAQAQHGAKRVLIFDFDVHHGNGTQDIFYHDPSVLFVSTHLFMPRMFYPGTGSFLEMGAASGEGYTLNVPCCRMWGIPGLYAFCRS